MDGDRRYGPPVYGGTFDERHVTVAARPLTGTVQERLIAIVASLLGAPPQWVSPTASFASLGLDSLGAVELTATIEDEMAVTLPLTAAHDYPSIEALARFIERGAADDASSRGRRLMLADAALPADIWPRAGRAALASDARDILLTGATGFLGAYLLRALLDETNANVHCVVRNASSATAKSRVLANLAEYDLTRSDHDAARIRIVRADLAAPLLGMSSRAFAELAERVDTIYHCGAAVNWVYAYEELRDANVLGTRELLRLAAVGGKPFHFVSSISVCQSTSAPALASESFDALTALDGVHLGYAQSKCVAEALVRQAAERGLPATIIRPSLVTGDARSGRSNANDLTSRLVAGCIRMGAAPDLDWRLDCVPVDDAARSIVRLTVGHHDGLTVSHLTARRPRHWRECVLWMRLAGYEIRLIPYREWLGCLSNTGRDHPLAPLRAFFATIVEEGLTLPELFEELRQPRVLAERTRGALCDAGATLTDVDLEVLGRYFDDYVARRAIPDAPRRVRSSSSAATPLMSRSSIAEGLSRRLGRPVTIAAIALRPVSTDESIIAELTSWRGGKTAGLMRGQVTSIDDAGIAATAEIFVKAKAADEQSIEVAEALGALISPALGREICAYRDRLGITRSHLRELAIYADDDPRVAAHRPAVLAINRDDEKARWVLALESIDDAVLMNALSPAAWSDDAIDAALRGVASIHARWLGAEAALRQTDWLGPVRDAAARAEMTPLWQALAEHALSRPAWCNPRLRAVHTACVRDVAGWSRQLDDAPRTLIHNDFNPRNIAIRRRDDCLALCAFDWELSTIGAPQRDVAEFLCFVLRPDASHETIRQWVERSRLLFNAAGQVEIDRARWERGFSAALCDLLVDRLAVLAMIDRVRPQSFLPRVVTTWLNVFDCFSRA
jgi:thioester reductase-like protein